MRNITIFLAWMVLAAAVTVILMGCGDDDPFIPVTPTPVPTVAPTATPAPPPDTCGEQEIANGFLWKPINDSSYPHRRGNLVVLFPRSFDLKFSDVQVNGESGEWAGFSNGERQTWYFDNPGCFYGSATVNADGCIWRIPDGCKRWE